MMREQEPACRESAIEARLEWRAFALHSIRAPCSPLLPFAIIHAYLHREACQRRQRSGRLSVCVSALGQRPVFLQPGYGLFAFPWPSPRLGLKLAGRYPVWRGGGG